jgi:hypothetical protein
MLLAPLWRNGCGCMDLSLDLSYAIPVSAWVYSIPLVCMSVYLFFVFVFCQHCAVFVPMLK